MTGPDTPKKRATEASECRSCGALILWCVWPRSGKRMPVDAEPVPEGDLVLTLHGGESGELRVEKYHSQVHGVEGRNRYVSHFATCPHAKEHRR